MGERQWTLEKQKYAEMQQVPKSVLSSMTLETSESAAWTLDHMVLRLSAYMLEHQVDEQYLEYPADWWEAVKERWLPAWAKLRWPVRRTRWRARIKAAYPDMEIPDQRAVYVTRFEREEDAHG